MAFIKNIEWFVSASTAIIVGLNALGFDLFKTLKIKQLQTFFCYIAGIAGIGSLIHFFLYNFR